MGESPCQEGVAEAADIGVGMWYLAAPVFPYNIVSSPQRFDWNWPSFRRRQLHRQDIVHAFVFTVTILY